MQLFRIVFVGIISLFVPILARAHVGYVVPHDQIAANAGPDTLYLLQALSDPQNAKLMAGVLLAILVIYYVAHKDYFIDAYLTELRKKLTSYYEFVPWILRLAVGIALIGAGAKGVLISPLLSGYEVFSFLQVLAGFLLLAGFMLIPAALTALGLFVFAFTRDIYILGNLELAAAALALVILDNPRPGIDDILLFPKMAVKELMRYVPIILRIGIGGSMLFLAFYEKLLNPHVAELVVSQFNLTHFIHVSPAMWVLSTGIIEAIIGIFLIIGFRTRLTSAVAFLVIAVTFFVFKEDVYSHVTLFGILSALFITGGGAYSIDKIIAKDQAKRKAHERKEILRKEMIESGVDITVQKPKPKRKPAKRKPAKKMEKK